MACRKRQRPSARDFFDCPPPEACAIENPSDSRPVDFLVDTQEDSARPEEYLSKLEEMNSHERVIELLRGKNRFDFRESSSNDKYLFIFKSKQSDGVMKDKLHLYDIARLLWGPGRKDVADGKAIYAGRLSFRVDDTRGITTDDVYTIEFSSQRLAELASGVVEFRLNSHLMSLQKEEDKSVLLIQAKIGSSRWLVKDSESHMVESKWRVIRKQIAFVRPLAKHESTPPKVEMPLPKADQMAFEISQLPSAFTVPQIVENLSQLKLFNLPIQIKLTQESNSDSPIRILLKFGDRTSAVICKINLYKFGLTLDKCNRIRFLIDEGDSSVKDTWNIWSNATTWDEEQIQLFVKSKNCDDAVKSEDEIDQLEDKPELTSAGSECQDIDELLKGSDESDTPHSRPPRSLHSMPYLQSLRRRQAEAENLIEKLTVEAEEEYLETKAAADGKPRSEFYRVSEQVGEDKKYNKLMKQMRRRRAMRRELKNYRKKNPLPTKVKQQRKEWRREQRQGFRGEAIESGDESSEEDSDDSGHESDASDEPDERYPATCSREEWETIRKKRRVRRVMEEKENSPSAAVVDKEKTLVTNSEVFQHKYSRPNEPLPCDVE
ncbi:hypothetical protein PTTG_28826 [Puccinia triticina 1-1 BBBD Race 1]|uniref:Uncharacterized protein n=2 Tax=Puccinia triticina TaxID=208348 RepID=A0A180G8M3_PUCT1|nr:uncharacterized protein PtA15_1A282 [Puccinia triticina]OAV89056.1 hypothetical protein PTTG_28826 [Puccinia triticina 1-1 BBBD Race 1]WAQ80944.1 hypothetical protein PtA15_1A282 [Puccinia triticina]